MNILVTKGVIYEQNGSNVIVDRHIPVFNVVLHIACISAGALLLSWLS